MKSTSTTKCSVRWRWWWGRFWRGDLCLLPLQALDAMLVDLFACFSNPRAIFVRRYVLAPSLRLSVVLLLMLRQSGAEMLAYGYVASSAFGLLVYGWVLVRMLR